MKIGVGRYSESLRRLLHIAGEPTQELDEVIQSNFVLENDRPEWGFLRGERLMGSLQTMAGVALQRSAVRLRNPAGSGILITVLQANLVEVSADAVPVLRRDMTFPTPTPAPAASQGSFDRRYTGIAAGVVEGENDTNANIVGSTFGFPRAIHGSAAQTWCHWDTPMILPPGTNLGFITDVDAVTLLVSFIWRERSLDRYELE